MFTQLMPLIGRRPLTITVAAEEGKLIRVNLIPHSLEADKKVNDSIPYTGKDTIASIPEDAIKGLTRALTLTGTPEEIDAGLIQNLAGFTASHVDLQRAFDEAKDAIGEAVRALKAREEIAKKERDAKKAKGKNTTTTKASVDVSEDKEEETEEEEPKPEPPPNLGLFT